MINDHCYIMVLAPMITKLKLKGNELLIFAIIHGFSQDGESHFTGSIAYLNQWTGLDKSTIISMLKKLVEKGYLKKYEFEINRVRVCQYSSNYFEILRLLENPTTPPQVEKSDNPPLDNTTAPVGKSNTIEIVNSNSLNKDIPGPIPGSLFPDQPPIDPNEEKAIKKLFRNSKVFDSEIFLSKFKGQEFEKIDLFHYYNAVNDWSEAKTIKRTDRGWIATVNQFIRRDIENKKLRLKVEFTASQKKVEMSGAMEYLKGDY